MRVYGVLNWVNLLASHGGTSVISDANQSREFLIEYTNALYGDEYE